MRLPIPPCPRDLEVPTGLEPVITELQSVALPTWLKNHNRVSLADCSINIHELKNICNNFLKFFYFFNFCLLSIKIRTSIQTKKRTNKKLILKNVNAYSYAIVKCRPNYV